MKTKTSRKTPVIKSFLQGKFQKSNLRTSTSDTRFITKPSHRVISLFFAVVFLQTLVPYNQLLANNNGPNAPEAAVFEPVDATDMVNLVTGDMSYVLPLLNVPSPEGGFPLALSYHAGIAMDLEASWVGLGWGLNPGAINRNVNGYPDDWGYSEVNHLFYDEGGSQEFYNVGIGANIYGVNVGVGAYWGSNKTLGGSVSLGVGPLGGTIEAGTGGIGVGAQVGVLSGGVSTNGINLGVGLNTSGGSGGINYNYNYKSGVSNSGYAGLKMSNLGVSLSSENGISYGVNGLGGSMSNSSVSANNGDYALQTTTKGINLDLFLFKFNFNKTLIKYSLFMRGKDHVSGILYPFANRKSNWGNSDEVVNFSPMDVSETIGFNKNVSPIALVNKSDQLGLDHILYPSYDNYSVNSQGISGSMAPMFLDEINLYGNGKEKDNERMQFYLGQNNDINLKLNNNLFFYFKNSQNSFYRNDRSNVLLNSGDNSFEKLKFAHTNTTNLYNSGNYTSGSKNLGAYKKRTGNYIETFTNDDITTGHIPYNFIEANGINRLQNSGGEFPSEGIGAFRIITLDGKVYHYSLPVYNYELYYKSFKNKENEDQNFYENSKLSPYATHWLLTAITGPDYFDKNGNNKVDEEDYGYWVEFDYGKWTDGYIWNSAPLEPNLVKGNYDFKDSYEYYRGRKQIYYLDKIKTRTHTAYFIKDVRDDSKGENYTYYKNKITGTNTNLIGSSKHFKSQSKRDFFAPGDYNTPKVIVDGDYTIYPCSYSGHDGIIRYADYPKHYSLKLEKIVLVNNNKNIAVDKSKGRSDFLPQEGFFYNNVSFEVTDTYYSYNAPCKRIGFGNWTRLGVGEYYKNDDFTLKKVKIHQMDNVIDAGDIRNLNIEDKADKVISFIYDYSMQPDSPNSDASNKGKLTLTKVYFGGKGGNVRIPPYVFDYNQRYAPFNKDLEDAWGFHKTYPGAWSLNEIKTPLGGKINIEYESDDYHKEAVNSTRVFNNGLSYKISSDSNFSNLYFDITKNDHQNAQALDGFENFTDYFEVGKSVDLDMFICRRSKYGGHRRQVNLNLDNVRGQIEQVSQNSVRVKVTNNSGFWHFDDQNQDWILNRIWSLTDVTFANNSSDGVIMRDLGLGECWGWRNSYDNDDVNFHCQISSSKIKSDNKGGGVRVKSIAVTDGINRSTKNYFYNQEGYNNSVNDANYRSSGVTSYAPSKETKPIPYASHIPAPLVMYNRVTVNDVDSNNNLISKNEYSFETLKPYSDSSSELYSLDQYFQVHSQKQSLPENLNLTNYKIVSNISNLGRLNSLKTFNNKGQLIFSKTNSYKDNTDVNGEIGVSQESYLSKSIVFDANTSCPEEYLCNISNDVIATTKVEYPSVLASTTTIQGGFTNTVYYDKHDFLTGRVLETRTVTSDGTTIKSKIVPAYTKYNNMGPKVDNTINNNMLTQIGANLTQIKLGEDWKMIGADISTWNNEWKYRKIDGSLEPDVPEYQKVWRKHKTFAWKGDLDNNGTYKDYQGDLDEFKWSGSQSNPKWVNTSTIGLYDHYSMPLESQDINGNSVATKMGDSNSKVIAVCDAPYTEMFYSGAEYATTNNNSIYLDGEIKTLGSVLKVSNAHTGSHIVRATNTNGFEVVFPANSNRISQKSLYKVSVWVRKGQENNLNIIRKVGTNFPFAKDFETNETLFAGDWVLLNGYIDIPPEETKLEIYSNGTSDFDDFRIHPVESTMTSYVYNEWDELTHILGSNNLATKYEYDDAGRLKKTSVEVVDAPNVRGGFKLQKEIDYNYKEIGKWDQNGDGILDNWENAALGRTLDLFLWIAKAKAKREARTTVRYGSGNYEYRWASGISENNLTYGNWTNQSTQYFLLECDEVRYYKCQVRDKVTQKVTAELEFTSRDCATENEEEEDVIVDPNNPE